ncbi:pre-peptidase C-terminal domain-containing protein [Planctomycetota bacterium]|nr:pre-peptidase C-terminal domain-containing protein [Planctomycetota bacterium]
MASGTQTHASTFSVVGLSGSSANLTFDLTEQIDGTTLDVGLTLAVYVDVDRNPGGVFESFGGTVDAQAAGSTLLLTLDPAPAPEHEVRVALTAGVLSTRGNPLVGGAHSYPLSFASNLPGAVFEGRVTPARVTAAATAAAGNDDHGDDGVTATNLVLNQAEPGAIDAENDVDWFALTLDAGADYVFETTSNGDTTLTLYGASGAELAFNDDANGLASRIDFTATTDGVHHLQVAGYGTTTPTYTITATHTVPAPTPTPTPTPAADDHAGDLAGGTPLARGSDAAGRIEIAGDTDVFRVWLDRNVHYTVTTASQGDTTLRVLDPSGAEVGFNDDDPQGGRTSRLGFQATTSGVFGLVVAAYSSNTLDYTVRAEQSPAAPPAPQFDPSTFVLHTGEDPWHIDFVTRRDLFEDDMRGHGLVSGDADTDRLARDRLIYLVLGHASEKYNREADGQPTPGAWRISFVSDDPPGRPGRSYSREVVGGRDNDSRSTLGVSYLDPGNRRMEDNGRLGELGIYSEVIFGRNSVLSPALRASDRRYLDGTYRLGDGGDDRRFRQVLDVIDDWAHALACIVSHEVGHSVGLNHDESDTLGIMQAQVGRWLLSNRRAHFSTVSADILDANLGVAR